MAIGFARLEFVKRSEGKTACTKAAYNSRSKVFFAGNPFMPSKTYDWSHKEKPVFHEIFLPTHVNEKYKDKELLWNEVERHEKRRDSQVGLELVLALPDDKIISTEDKIELVKSFLKKEFTSNGLGVQLDIHSPDQKSTYSEITGEFETKNHNLHAHLLVTTRKFDRKGECFEAKKPRELMPIVRGGDVISGANWGKLWTQHQNEFFEERGLSLRVDPNGTTPQMHMGPTRMRRAYGLMEKQETLIKANELSSKNPSKILEKLTETRSIFNREDFEQFQVKHIPGEDTDKVRTAFWNQPDIIQLYDPIDKTPLQKFTSKEVIVEEQTILRLAKKIHSRKAITVNKQHEKSEFSSNLNEEQKKAYKNIILGRSLICVEGHAGTGKSYLLFALKNYYESNKYRVRALGPDNATAQVLKEKGFKNATNIHQFLFTQYYGKENVQKGQEIWMIDEAGKLGNRALLELLRLAEKKKAQIILSGNTSQLPSVERGGAFKQFCDMFGYEFLGDIQRQKIEHQKDIAKKLAFGKFSEAFDTIAKTGGFVWSSSKEEAIENTVRKWASDKMTFPYSSSIIIAHSNAEIRVLNEMARNFRKAIGEVSEKEYECQTTFGKIYVSEGDLIEFRKINRDLGVSNGSVGVLLKASSNEFRIALKENAKNKEVTFDPNKYASFQLGYATTYYRAQGRTIDRAYILHSHQMNKEMFYVGLTRHVRSVTCFISRTEVRNLSDLKRQTLRSSFKETTQNYTTMEMIEAEKQIAVRNQKIQTLKSSNSIKAKALGIGLDSWESLYLKACEAFGYFRDRSANQVFYNPEIPEDPKGTVVEVTKELPEMLTSGKAGIIVPNSDKPYDTLSTKINEDQSKRAKNFHNLSEIHQVLLKQYYQRTEAASLLHEIVKSEIVSSDVSKTTSPHFKEWQEACKVRNQSANQICESICGDILNRLFSKKSLDILRDRSETHALANVPKVNIHEKLKEHAESLLFKLFPEGPTRIDSKGYRFGSKGSLAVVYNGSKAGSFYDHERGEGGNLLTLIQRQLGLDHQNAKQWVSDFLQEVGSIQCPSSFLPHRNAFKKEEDWVSLRPSKSVREPSLIEISKYLNERYNLVSKHPYRDEEGNILFYNLRLEEKLNPTNKIVLPCSYGHWLGHEADLKWGLKKYQTETGQNIIYNLDALGKEVTKPVLIVEGEKAADAGSKLFGHEIVSVSWFGGSGAASKVDWRPLFGRDVIIWPDNDTAGFKAGNEICSSLRKVGVRSLRMVDNELIKKEFPEKWDIADPLPTGKSKQYLHDCLLTAHSKSIGLDKLTLYMKDGLSHINHLNEILWRVEERLRPILESEHSSKTWEIDNKIIQELSSIFGNEKTLTNIITDNGIAVHQKKAIVFQGLIYLARTGNKPSVDNLQQIKQVIDNFTRSLQPYDENGYLAFDRVVAHALECNINEPDRMRVYYEYQKCMGQGSQILQKEKETQKVLSNSLEI